MNLPFLKTWRGRPGGRQVRAALGLSLLLTSSGLGRAQSAPTQPSIRVGLQAGGTLSWVTFAVQYFGIDKELGLKLDAQTYASKDAIHIALRSGAAQVVDDFLEVILLHQNRFDVSAVYPFSLLAGGLVVPTASPIRTVADLKDQTIGATSLTDKTLLLRAYTRAKAGFDPQTASKVVAVSSPLMGQLMTRGEVNASLPLWHHAARMISSGEYRQVISRGELMKGLGLNTSTPLLYLIARTGTDPQALGLFVKAVLKAEERMKTDDGFWNAMLEKNLYALPNRAELPALCKQWAMGLPKSWTAADLNNTVLLTRKMIEVAGPEVVGLTRLNTRAFNTTFRP